MTSTRTRRASATATVAVLALVLPACDAGGGEQASPPPKRTCEPGPPYGKGNWPPAPCWRPYHDRSPFQDEIDGDREYPNSAAMVARLLADPTKHPANLVVDVDGHSGEPTYYSAPTDPEYALHCTMQVWTTTNGPCAIEGHKVRIPDGAFVEANTPAKETNADPGYMAEPDAHLTVVDQASGWEYDLWQVHRSPVTPAGGNELRFSWGGRTRIDGDGVSREGNATAAHFGSLAGRIRAEELAAKKIDHALSVVIPCDHADPVYPARGDGRECANATDAIPMGARLHLDLTDEQLDELRADGVPEWKLAILTALQRYGAYVNDTGSDGAWFQFEQESGSQYAAVGDANPWLAFAKANENAGGWFHKAANQEPTYPAEHYVGILRKDADGIDWKDRVWRHLRVVAPSHPDDVEMLREDPTAPLVSLGAEPQPGKGIVGVHDATPAAPVHAVPRDHVVSLLAQGRDAESGIRETRIVTETTTWSAGPGGGEAADGPPQQRVVAQDRDPTAHAPGETVRSNRIVGNQIRFEDLTAGRTRVRVEVWSTARTYRGHEVASQRIVLTSP